MSPFETEHDHEPIRLSHEDPKAHPEPVEELPMWAGMPVLAVRVWDILPLRTEAREPRLESMDARILVPLLAGERTRFVRQVRRRLPTDADAEDVVQRAMMRATERAGSLDDPERLRAWFGRILRRGIADFHRSRRPEDASESAGVDVPADAEDARHTACACSTRLLDALPARYADVLRRVDVDGQTPELAAAALSISTANLHVRLHRARRALRERVMKHCGVSMCGPCLDCSCDAHGRCGGGMARPIKDRASPTPAA
jgi:RNA polymerase sigma factor (sigma-70 family)